MSVKATTWVWEASRAAGNARLVMLALADYADDDGGRCYPSIGTLSSKTLLSERTVQRCIRELEELGELAVLRQQGPGVGRHRPNRYRLTGVSEWGDSLTPRGRERGDSERDLGCQDRSSGVTLVSPNSPRTTSEPPGDSLSAGGVTAAALPAAGRERERAPLSRPPGREELWAAHRAAVGAGEVSAPTSADRAVLDELAGLAASPGAVRARTEEMVRRIAEGEWSPKARPTLRALLKNWHDLEPSATGHAWSPESGAMAL